MEISAVIGANYGDEGKGHVVDYLADQGGGLVVRHNGGAQAGHTVVTPEDERRHVFHHIGSGAFNTTPTLLSRFFIVNPAAYMKELKEILAIGVDPTVMADMECYVSTPYDMILNQLLEAKRGAAKHGSCGFGINETMIRNKTPYGLQMIDLEQDTLEDKINKIRKEYFKNRMEALGLTEEDLREYGISPLDDGIMASFMKDIEGFKINVSAVDTRSVFKEYTNVIFEGAQGLRLDRDSHDFPHVTNSKTGLENVVRILSEARIVEPIKVFYVSRPYLTRHGAGPLPNELPGPPFEKIVDATNIPNPFQGALRFAHLDFARLRKEILMDLRTAPDAFPKFVMTCLDHSVKQWEVEIDMNGDIVPMNINSFASLMEREVGIREVLFANGPTREGIFKSE